MPHAQTGAEHGFTLIEMLMALMIFAMIAGLTYSSMDVAGNGFEQLAGHRKQLEQSGWVGKQLRQDVRYLCAAPHQATTNNRGIGQSDSNEVPIRIVNDNRGDVEFDELWLLVREPGTPAVSQVHYFIDEESAHLIRESRSLLARKSIEPVRWDFGEARSWGIEIYDPDGNVRQDWDFRSAEFVWPKAVTATMLSGSEGSAGEQQRWMMQVLMGNPL